MVSVRDVPESYDGGSLGSQEPWKVIKAAVCGYSEGDSKISGYCDPESLAQAASAFVYAQDLFQLCHEIFEKSARSIAGRDRVWQGAAAEAFLERMQAHAKVMEKHLQTITGWAGKSGSTDLTGGKDSIVTGLINAANTLAVAQAKLEAIDSFHANQAHADYAPSGSGGLVAVSSRPAVLKLLNEDMSTVFTDLQQNYADNTKRYYRAASGDTIVSPGSGGTKPPTFDRSSWNPPTAAELGNSGAMNFDAAAAGTGSFGPTPWDGDSIDPSSFTATPSSWGTGDSAWDPSTVSTGAGSFDPSGSTGFSASGYPGGSGSGSYGVGNGPGSPGTGAGAGAVGFVGGGLGGRGVLGANGFGANGPGGAGGGQGEQERERNTWLVEDPDVWGADPELPPDVIGRR